MRTSTSVGVGPPTEIPELSWPLPGVLVQQGLPQTRGSCPSCPSRSRGLKARCSPDHSPLTEGSRAPQSTHAHTHTHTHTHTRGPDTRRPAAPRPLPGLPWLGSIPAYLGSKFFPQKVADWARSFGGVFQVHLKPGSSKPYVVVTDPKLVPAIVGRGSKGLPKSPGYHCWTPMLTSSHDVQARPGGTGLTLFNSFIVISSIICSQ